MIIAYRVDYAIDKFLLMMRSLKISAGNTYLTHYFKVLAYYKTVRDDYDERT